MLAGSGVYAGHNLAITVWGDDPTTGNIEGLQPGDKLIYSIWRAENGETILAEARYGMGDEFYEHDGISILKKLEASSEGKDDIYPRVKAYPNPFNDELAVEFLGTKEEKASISILDIYGKKAISTDVKVNEGFNTMSFTCLS